MPNIDRLNEFQKVPDDVWCCNLYQRMFSWVKTGVSITGPWRWPYYKRISSCHSMCSIVKWYWSIYSKSFAINVAVSVYRMHCKMVFNFTVRHDHAFKSCKARWPLIGLRNLILIGQLRLWWKHTKAFFTPSPL